MFKDFVRNWDSPFIMDHFGRQKEIGAGIGSQLQDKKLKLHINRLFPLNEKDLIEAHTLIETKHTNGKLVIQIRN